MPDHNAKYLDILQIFRGIAAVMVVIHHTVPAFVYYQNIKLPLLSFIAQLGKHGIDFFFLLSGFIISYSVQTKDKTFNEFKKYMLNRIIRIYVPYLPIGILLYFLYSTFSMSNVNRDIDLITSFTLFPNGIPALSVAWTLSYEMMFYILFGLSFISIRFWNIFSVIWLLTIILFNYVFSFNFSHIIFFNKYNIDFLLGYLLYLFYVKKINISPKWTISLIILFSLMLLFLKYNHINLFSISSNLISSILFFFLIYFYITYYNNKKNADFLLKLGSASYSIYLIHNPLMSILVRIMPKMNLFTYLIEILITIVVCCFCGYLYHLIFEKYLTQKIKHFIIKHNIS